jgi:DNA-binding transcriptional MerR regulator
MTTHNEGGDVHVTDELMDTGAAATYLDVSARTVRNYATEGDLPIAGRKRGKRGEYLFRQSDVAALYVQLYGSEKA